MKVTIYHNPRCSKSRQTLELLQQHDVEIDVVEYLKTPPDADRLAHLLRTLGVGARDLLRTGEAAYRELGLDDPSVDESALLDAMAEHPVLIQRPIVVAGDRAVIGRPPENVHSLFE